MFFKNSLNYFSQFFFFISNQIKNFYLNSKIYNKKISKISNKSLEYKPSPSLLDCLIKYEKKKIKIEDLYLNSVWTNKNLSEKDYNNLHSFFWLFSLDLKSSKKITQSVVLNWIEDNVNYNKSNWEINILSKRIIAWISNSKLTYENSETNYKLNFNKYKIVKFLSLPVNFHRNKVNISSKNQFELLSKKPKINIQNTLIQNLKKSTSELENQMSKYHLKNINKTSKMNIEFKIFNKDIKITW